jgi:hypothetical protein
MLTEGVVEILKLLSPIAWPKPNEQLQERELVLAVILYIELLFSKQTEVKLEDPIVLKRFHRESWRGCVLAYSPSYLPFVLYELQLVGSNAVRWLSLTIKLDRPSRLPFWQRIPCQHNSLPLVATSLLSP